MQVQIARAPQQATVFTREVAVLTLALFLVYLSIQSRLSLDAGLSPL